MRHFNTYPGLKLSFRLKFRVDYCLVRVRLSFNRFVKVESAAAILRRRLYAATSSPWMNITIVFCQLSS